MGQQTTDYPYQVPRLGGNREVRWRLLQAEVGLMDAAAVQTPFPVDMLHSQGNVWTSDMQCPERSTRFRPSRLRGREVFDSQL